MKGSVFKRCPCGVTGVNGKRACKTRHGSWYYVADLGRDSHGKRLQQKKGGYDRQEDAQDALTALMARVKVGQYHHDERRKLGEYLAEWIDQKVGAGLRPTTERAYRHHIRDYLTPHLGHLRLRDIRPGHIAAMLRSVAAGDGTRPGPSPATLRRIRATLQSALATAVKDQLVTYNAAKLVEMPKVERFRVSPWEPAELGRFLDYVAGDRLGPLLEFMAMTGLRRGEALGLRWSDVDLNQGELYVRQQLVTVGHQLQFGKPKTSAGEDRRVTLGPQLVGTLLAHRLAQDQERAGWGEAYQDHGLVFTREDGTPVHPSSVTKRFRELAIAAGVRPVRLHDLRHGAASLMIAQGVNLSVVSKRLGHSSISITNDTYTHLLADADLGAATATEQAVPRSAPRDQVVTRGANPQDTVPSAEAVSAGQSGGPPETRTRNLWIKSPQLCH